MPVFRPFRGPFSAVSMTIFVCTILVNTGTNFAGFFEISVHHLKCCEFSGRFFSARRRGPSGENEKARVQENPRTESNNFRQSTLPAVSKRTDFWGSPFPRSNFSVISSDFTRRSKVYFGKIAKLWLAFYSQAKKTAKSPGGLSPGTADVLKAFSDSVLPERCLPQQIAGGYDGIDLLGINKMMNR